jgi:cell division transport system permease protein
MRERFMKSLKNHLSFIIPLFILLFSIQFSSMLDRGVKNYEAKLAGEYTIITISTLPLDFKKLKESIPSIKTLTEIPKDKYIEKLKEDISKADLVFLKANLPKFYSIKLATLPDSNQLNSIAAKLKSVKGVKKVETFKKTFNKFHQFLKLSKSASFIFTVFIFIISFLLIIKQMEIWTLQHSERMYIMGLFGAPYWMKSASLYKSVIIDALIASVLVGLAFLAIPSFADFNRVYQDLGIDLRNFHFMSDTLKLIGISLLISIVSVTTIIIKKNIQE